MKFTEAKEKLKELAGGKYHAIGYELTEYAGGRQETECYLYIDSKFAGRGYTWKEAFMKLNNELGITQTEEIPEV